jgi:hypothetical protein
MGKFEESWYQVFFKDLVQVNGESIGSWAFLCEENIISLISLLNIDLLWWFISNWFNFECSNTSKNLISSRCSSLFNNV